MQIVFHNLYNKLTKFVFGSILLKIFKILYVKLDNVLINISKYNIENEKRDVVNLC